MSSDVSGSSPSGTAAGGRARWAAAAPMAIVGVLCVIAGGLLPAVTASVITRELAWLSAFLVLVAGVAAVALGFGQAFLGAHVPRGILVYAELVVYFAGNALVITGSLSGFPILTDVGGGLLVLALVGFVWGARGARGPRTWALYAYRAVIVILLVSIPIGLVLAHLRAG